MLDYSKDYFSDGDFNAVYKKIKEYVTFGCEPMNEKCTIILGGQPGAGKSTYYSTREDPVSNSVIINGDDYRRFHPNFSRIIRSDAEHMAERTQDFTNRVVERLITDLGNDGYNMIIEGTLRNPQVPINTCKELQSKGYNPDLVVVACDAEKAWISTIKRAEALQMQHEPVRLVPFDTYDYTVNQIPINIEIIEKEKCFNSISIVNRDGDYLYKTGDMSRPKDVLIKELNLDNWNKVAPSYEKDYINKKIELLQASLKTKERDRGFER